MRAWSRLFLLVAASAGLHGAGFAALAWVEPDARAFVRPDAGAIIEISIESLRAPEPIEPPPARSQMPAAPTMAETRVRSEPPEPRARQESAPMRRDTEPAKPSPAEPAPTAAIEPARPSLLAMRMTGRTSPTGALDPRAPERPGALDLSPARAAQAVHSEPEIGPRSPLEMSAVPRIPGPRVERSESMMTPDGNGTFRYDHAGFKAKVERDGSVHIEDKPSFQPMFEGPCLECVRRDLGKYTEDPSSGFALDLMALLPKIGGRFDLTDWVMRKIGDDPYSYEKERFLDNTRDERQVMRVAETDDRLREALQLLPKQLERIWAHEAWPPSQRKRALFELWDECAEDGPAERVALGRSIRAAILAFIRKRLPAGSQHAYTEAEIEALSHERRSRQPFVPYPPAAEDTASDAGDAPDR